MKNWNFALRGDICWSTSPQSLAEEKNAFAVCAEGKSAGVFSRLPRQYAGFPLIDCPGRLITPGLVDLHVHAPQFA
ncbi:MAG: hypothetical protein FWH38_06935, partial [Treponema sp.]|nr:hypothetical protein [Treponema sp.]